MNLSDIQTLFEYNYWAWHRIIPVAETLSEEQYQKNLGSSHGGIHGTLVHAVGAEETWLRRWRGDSPTSFPTPANIPTLAALKERWNRIEREVMSFIGTLRNDEDIRRTITYKDIKGNSYTQVLYQTMQHAVNHGSYHRGQVSGMIRQLGVKPANTDLINFYRQKTQGA
jgi:uncharacterized damage-inducible protein DinB